MKKLIKLLFKIFLSLTIVLLAFVVYMHFKYPIFIKEFKPIIKTSGLLEGFIPQGLDYLDDDTIIYAGYMHNDKPSRIYISKDNNDYYLELYLDETTPFKGHTGGITVYNDYVYLANDDNTKHAIYTIPLSALYSENQKIILNNSFIPLNRASTCTIHDNYLWIGEYHDNKNYLPNPKHIINNEYNSLIVAYQINNDGSINSIPHKILATSDHLQGIAFSKNNEIALSKSKGFMSSKISIYDDCLRQEPNMLYQYEGNTIPLWFIDDKYLTNEIILPPMSEELFFKDDSINLYFESASLKYYYGFLTRGNYIYTYKYTK